MTIIRVWLKGYLSKTPGPKVSGNLWLSVAEIPHPRGEQSDPKEKYRCEHERRILPPVAYAKDGVEHEAGDRAVYPEMMVVI